MARAAFGYSAERVALNELRRERWRAMLRVRQLQRAGEALECARELMRVGALTERIAKGSTMKTPFFAGFEGAHLHWNNHCTLESTRHTPETDLEQHYAAAIAVGANGFRETLPERIEWRKRYKVVRQSAGDRLVVWSTMHFCRPEDPLGHASRVAKLMGPHDRMICVNEPSVGYAVSGRGPGEATALAAAMMANALQCNPQLRFWTCDPLHQRRHEDLASTRALIHVFGKNIETVGINVYPMHTATPLRELLRFAQDAFPDHRIALTETGWHDGHPQAEANWPGIRSRAEWWDYVQGEIDAADVELAAACWYPFVSMSWEPGDPWPNGFPYSAA